MLQRFVKTVVSSGKFITLVAAITLSCCYDLNTMVSAATLPTLTIKQVPPTNQGSITLSGTKSPGTTIAVSNAPDGFTCPFSKTTTSTSTTWSCTASGYPSGSNTVSFSVTDSLNNTTSKQTAFIYDADKPIGNITITGSESTNTYTNKTSVLIQVSCDGTGTAPTSMQFRNGSGTWSTWDAFKATKTWTLQSANAPQTVWFQCKDAAGNVSDPTTAQITLDSAKPAGTLTILGTEPINRYTKDPTVQLVIKAADNGGSGVSKMQVSESATFVGAPWEAYQESRAYTFSSATNSVKNVYARFMDTAGNISTPTKGSITLDTIPPALSVKEPLPTSQPTITITGTKEVGSTITVSPPLCSFTTTTTKASASWSCIASGYPFNQKTELAFSTADTAGNSTTKTAIVFYHAPPVANAGPDQTAQVYDLVTLDGGLSSGDLNLPLGYEWKVVKKPLNSSFELSPSDRQHVAFIADTVGEYQISLKVRDGLDCLVPSIVKVNLVPTTKKIKGKLIPPPGYTPESFLIGSLSDPIKVLPSGEFTAAGYNLGVNFITAIPDGKDFGFLSVFVSSAVTQDTTPEIQISAGTTAVSMIFMSPFLMTRDPVLAQKLIDIIQGDPTLPALTSAVEGAFNDSDPFSNSTLLNALDVSLQSVLSSLPNDIAPTAQSVVRSASLPAVPNDTPFYLDRSFVDVEKKDGQLKVESNWKSGVSWVATAVQINPYGIETWDHLVDIASPQSLYSAVLMPGEITNGPINMVNVPANSALKWVKVFDAVSDLIFDKVMPAPGLKINDTAPNVYLVRAFSCGRADTSETGFAISNYVYYRDRACLQGYVELVFDVLTLWVDLGPEKPLIVNAVKNAVTEIKNAYLALPTPATSDDYLSVYKRGVSKFTASLEADAVGKTKYFDKNYITKCSFLTAARNINVAGKLLPLGQIALRQLQLEKFATAVESSVVVIGNPFRPLNVTAAYPGRWLGIWLAEVNWKHDSKIDRYYVYIGEDSTVSKAHHKYKDVCSNDKPCMIPIDKKTYVAVSSVIGDKESDLSEKIVVGVDHLKDASSTLEVFPYGKIDLSVQAYDANEVMMPTVVTDYDWKLISGKGSVVDGTFTASKTAGPSLVQATLKADPTKKRVLTITTKPFSGVAIISPAEEIYAGGTLQLTAKAFVNDVEVPTSATEYTWAVTYGPGTVNTAGMYTASNIAGLATISAKYKDSYAVSGVKQISVFNLTGNWDCQAGVCQITENKTDIVLKNNNGTYTHTGHGTLSGKDFSMVITRTNLDTGCVAHQDNLYTVYDNNVIYRSGCWQDTCDIAVAGECSWEFMRRRF